MKLIAKHYEMEKNGEGYVYNGVDFEGLNSRNEEFFDFIVYDMGVLDSKYVKGFINCKVRIICTGVKPHEIFYYEKCIGLLRNTQYITFVKDLYNSKEKNVYNVNHDCDIFDSKNNKATYNMIIKDLVKDT